MCGLSVLIIAGFFSDASKAPAAYLEPFNDSVRLFMAAFNWLSHGRKDNARNSVHDNSFGEICGWDTPVGKENLWPFDVRKKVDELKKTKKLGAPNYNYKGKGKFPRSRPSFSFKRSKSTKQKYFLGKNNNKSKKKQ